PILVLETQAIVHREIRPDAPIVLRIATVVVREAIERRRQRDRTLPVGQRRRESEQERRECVAVGRAAVAAVRRSDVLLEVEEADAVAWVEVVESNLPEVGAGLERMRAN